MVKEQGKEAGGPWDCYLASNFFGWEDDRVVAVTDGCHIMEMITRAKTLLAVIFVGGGYNDKETKEYFQQAAEQGLIDIVSLSPE